MTVMSLLCLVVPLFHARPVLVMIASQAFNAIYSAADCFYVCSGWANKPSLMGKISLLTLGKTYVYCHKRIYANHGLYGNERLNRKSDEIGGTQ